MISLLAFALFSCSSEDNIDNITDNGDIAKLGKLDIESFQKFESEPTDGVFALVSDASVSTQEENGIVSVSGGFTSEVNESPGTRALGVSQKGLQLLVELL